MEEVLRELGELAGAEEGLGVDHVGRQDFGVAVLAGVEVEHEVGEGALEACSLAVVDDEAGAGDFGGAVEVEDAEGSPISQWGLAGKSNCVGCPRSFRAVLACSSEPTGTESLGRLGSCWRSAADLEIGFVARVSRAAMRSLREVGSSVTAAGVFAFALEAADLLRESVALGLEGFGLGDGGAAGGVEVGEVGEEGGVGATLPQFFFDQREVGADKG